MRKNWETFETCGKLFEFFQGKILKKKKKKGERWNRHSESTFIFGIGGGVLKREESHVVCCFVCVVRTSFEFHYVPSIDRVPHGPSAFLFVNNVTCYKREMKSFHGGAAIIHRLQSNAPKNNVAHI